LLLASVPAGAQGLVREAPEPVVVGEVERPGNPALARIERRLIREPAYKKSPRYCLVVFGRKAEFRVWVVIDGDTVYVDLNGNGDLTEKGEQFKLQTTERGPYGPPCEVGDIFDPHTRLKHTKFTVGLWGTDSFRLGVDAAFASRKVPHLYGFANVTFGRTPAEAPVVRFGGPLSMELSVATIGDRPAFLCPEIGTPGLGKGSFVYYTGAVFHATAKEVTPELELEYPGERGAVIRQKARFYRDSIESTFLYPVHPGEKGDRRQVKITLSFYQSWAVSVDPQSFTRPLLTLPNEE
jgi:hypothetical protein